MRLTDLHIQKLPVPEKGQKTYWEEGFGVRVSQGGSKSFVIMYGKDRRLKTIGRYPEMSLKTARTEAKRLLTIQSSPTPTMSLAEARSAYLEACEKKNRPATVDNYRHYLKQLTKESLSDVTVDDLPDTSHAIMAGKVFFNWCIRHELVQKNPFAYSQVSYGKRDRVLTPDEIKAVWQYDHPPFSDYVKLMLLTGIRKGECVNLTVKDDTVYLAPDHTKNGKALTLPLTPMVEALLPIPYFNGWSKGKKRMDEKTKTSGFTLHDLRRTCATIHAQIGTPIHIVEAMLNHASGTVSGVAAIYIRHNFLTEMRTAALQYEAYIAKLVDARA
jgi:integrase